MALISARPKTVYADVACRTKPDSSIVIAAASTNLNGEASTGGRCGFVVRACVSCRGEAGWPMLDLLRLCRVATGEGDLEAGRVGGGMLSLSAFELGLARD